MVLKPFARPSKTMYNKTMSCLGGLAHGLKTICKALLQSWVILEALHMVLKPFARPSKTMYNKTMSCLGGLAHGLKTMCKAT